MAEQEMELPGISNRTTRAILGTQVVITALAALTLQLLVGSEAGWSALVGGGIGILSTAWFALRVFAGGKKDTRSVVRRFYIAETQKIVLTVLLFVAVIVWLEVSFLAVFGTYVLTLLAFWFALLPALSGDNPKDLS